MSAAQELLGLLFDARPRTTRHSKPAEKYSEKYSKPALKAVRFTVELPELGGAVELCPRMGFDPVYCARCGAAREQEQYTPRCWSVLPCKCRGPR